MFNILTYDQIDQQQWQELVQSSAVSTWFQTDEAYRFYQSVGGMQAFAYGVSEEGRLVGVVVGYVTKNSNSILQYFTKRAIIYGGPLLHPEISDFALSALLKTIAQNLDLNPIYIETRNFNDYSQWKDIFEINGFGYKQKEIKENIDGETYHVLGLD